MRVAATTLVLCLAAAPCLGDEPIAPVGMVDQACPAPLPLPAEYARLRELDLRPQPADDAEKAVHHSAETDAYDRAWEALHERDWAGLCRFAADNAALAAQGAVRMVFMGDSITENWLSADPQLFSHGIVNRGISGQTSPQMLVRFHADVVALHPRAVHILAGANDLAGNTGPTTPQDFRNNIMAMCEIARANGIEVILGALLPADHFPWRPGVRPVPRIAELNAWLRDYARAQHFRFVDYHAPLAGAGGAMRAGLTHDGVHPHRDGYRLMRQALEPALRGVTD